MLSDGEGASSNIDVGSRERRVCNQPIDAASKIVCEEIPIRKLAPVLRVGQGVVECEPTCAGIHTEPARLEVLDDASGEFRRRVYVVTRAEARVSNPAVSGQFAQETNA